VKEKGGPGITLHWTFTKSFQSESLSLTISSKVHTVLYVTHSIKTRHMSNKMKRWCLEHLNSLKTDYLSGQWSCTEQCIVHCITIVCVQWVYLHFAYTHFAYTHFAYTHFAYTHFAYIQFAY
jgi:hypothetical protein